MKHIKRKPVVGDILNFKDGDKAIISKVYMETTSTKSGWPVYSVCTGRGDVWKAVPKQGHWLAIQ